MPFTAENFALSFSLPNFYFRDYRCDILRMKGVKVAKWTFSGKCVSEFNEPTRGKLLIKDCFLGSNRSIEFAAVTQALAWLPRLQK